jgi:DNA-binding winged helix-turn-helix (wHTH) protein/TolB-like protein
MDSRPAAYEFNQFRLEPRRRRLLREAQLVPLTPKVFDTLLLLVERRGEVVTKEEVFASVWRDAAVEENNLGQAISKLRQALGEVPGENAYIATIPGRGYRFVAETRVVDERSDDGAPAVIGSTAGSDGQRRPRRGITWRVVGASLLVGLCVTLVYFSFMRRGTNAESPVTSLAVLPFKPLVPQNRDQALEFGLADILIGRLATLNNLSVRSLGTVRRYSDTTINPVDAGRELGVDVVLDGHIHRSDQRIRVTARLVRVADERQLWSGQFDEEFKNVFDIQDSIARRVAQELAPELDGGVTERNG